jgi:hypothetical protein
MDVEIEAGEYWEGLPWKLIIPYEENFVVETKLCKHAVLKGEAVAQLRSDGSIWGHRQSFVLPHGVAQCKNEAGHNGTALCLDCLDEARAAVGKDGGP